MKSLIYDNLTMAMIAFMMCGGFFAIGIQMIAVGSMFLGIGMIVVSLANGFLGMGWHGREQRKTRKLKNIAYGRKGA